MHLGIASILGRSSTKTFRSAGSVMTDQLLRSTKDHISAEEPKRHKTADRLGAPRTGHYSPDKVTPGGQSASSYKAEGSALVAIPGITRAYKTLHIMPNGHPFLAIPENKTSYGKWPSDFGRHTQKGLNLYRMDGGALVWMYSLRARVTQHQDPTMMPKDETYFDNLVNRITAEFSAHAGQQTAIA